MTDWRKLDLALADALADALAGALGSAAPRATLTVFVHFDPEAAESLRERGIDAGQGPSGIATATLGASEIGALSDQPWVRQIRLSSPLRLLDE